MGCGPVEMFISAPVRIWSFTPKIMKTKCANCFKEIERKPSYIRRYKNSFCSQECKSNFQNKKIKIKCKTCGKILLRRPLEIKKTKNGYCFCSRSCTASWNNQQEWRVKENHPNWIDGSSSGRSIALKNKEHICEKCNFKEFPEILQVHHKNRNRKDNSIDNLEVLCPNCHHKEHFRKGDGMYWNKK